MGTQTSPDTPYGPLRNKPSFNKGSTSTTAMLLQPQHPLTTTGSREPLFSITIFPPRYNYWNPPHSRASMLCMHTYLFTVDALIPFQKPYVLRLIGPH